MYFLHDRTSTPFQSANHGIASASQNTDQHSKLALGQLRHPPSYPPIILLTKHLGQPVTLQNGAYVPSDVKLLRSHSGYGFWPAKTLREAR